MESYSSSNRKLNLSITICVARVDSRIYYVPVININLLFSSFDMSKFPNNRENGIHLNEFK